MPHVTRFYGPEEMVEVEIRRLPEIAVIHSDLMNMAGVQSIERRNTRHWYVTMAAHADRIDNVRQVDRLLRQRRPSASAKVVKTWWTVGINLSMSVASKALRARMQENIEKHGATVWWHPNHKYLRVTLTTRPTKKMQENISLALAT